MKGGSIIEIQAHSLFSKQSIFVSDATTQDAVFDEVAAKLLEDGCVKDGFIEHVKEREANYPTGIDVSPISADLPNVAIPHTEGEYVNRRMIVPVRLLNPIKFQNMINPSETLEVKFLFMILNNDPVGQANILAEIMDFLGQTPVEELNKLFNMTDSEEIFNFLEENFKQE